MPMQNLLLLAELKALGVCPCRIYYFRRTGGIGRVPMQNLLLLAELKALGVCPCRIYYFWPNWVSIRGRLIGDEWVQCIVNCAYLHHVHDTISMYAC